MISIKPPAAASSAGVSVPSAGPASACVPFSRSAFWALFSSRDGGGPVGARRATWPPLAAAPLRRASSNGVSTSRPGPSPRRETAARVDDPLDPVHRRRAAYAPPCMFSGPMLMTSPPPAFLAQASGAEPVARAAASLEDLIPALVRRIAWSSDGRRGTVRLEIGAGELAGSTLVVHADAGRVRVHLDVRPGVDARAWQARIHDRLASRNIPTDRVEVT